MIPGEIVQDIYRLWKEWVELGNTEFEHPDDPDDVDDLFGKIAAVKSIHEQMEYRGVTPKQIKYLRYVRSFIGDIISSSYDEFDSHDGDWHPGHPSNFGDR
jgi:hypothetical protein